ncbi:ABC-three component system middle component 6 [Bradyrhizobium sp. SYSU BS000235]|uniref:ABC-three component system middle component 6 n=1 Tax=Bradyrhizobium sp. SYSU BS000235 TaxID=3411332 RepID=UPI003C75EB08
MILPGKHIKQDRALIAVGGDILSVLDRAMTVSSIWRKVQVMRATREDASPVSFDWFILALTLLYAISALDRDGDLITPVRGSA